MTPPAAGRADAIAAAATIADEGGFASVTATAVAKRLGIRTPSLYAHVRDLGALRDGVTALAFEELSDRVADAVAGRAGRDALAGLADAHREYALRHPGRWQSLQRPPEPGTTDLPGAARLVQLTDAVLHGYDLARGERVHAVRLLGSTINGFLTLEQSGAFAHRSPSASSSWRRVVDALDLLLRAWPADPKDPS